MEESGCMPTLFYEIFDGFSLDAKKANAYRQINLERDELSLKKSQNKKLKNLLRRGLLKTAIRDMLTLKRIIM